MTRVSFSGVTAFEPLEAGDYAARFTQFESKVGKESNQPFIKCTFDIMEPGLENRKQWRNFSLQPQSLFALKQFIDIAGGTYPTGDDEEEFEIEDVLRDIIGSEVVLEVIVKEYQGRPTNEVKAVKEGRLF